jgi:hypothetical protein
MAATPGRGPRPDLFVVGDAKCGTTSLNRLFELAPGVGTPRARKELHFFAAPELVARVAGPGDDRIPPAVVQDEAAYLAEYAHLAPGLAAVADVSPSYLRNPAAPARIAAFAPEPRIVILLREPAAKVFSQYVHLWAEGREALPFEAAFAESAARAAAGFSDLFDYAGGGFYAEAVARWLDRFGERVLVLLFEELTGDPDAALGRLGAFLGTALPPGPLPRLNVGGRPRSRLAARLLGNRALRSGARTLLPLGLRTRLGQGIGQRLATERPALAPETRAMLRARFAPDRPALEVLLGRPTGWPAA